MSGVPADQLGVDPHTAGFRALATAYLRGALSVLPQVLATQWLPREVVRHIAERRFTRIVAHAARHVPHYRTTLPLPRGTFDRAAIARLPLLTKEILRERAGDLLAEMGRPREELQRRSSSGSSGTPVRIYFHPLLELHRRVQELRLLTAHGYRPWHRQMIFDAPSHLAPRPFLPQRLGLWRREPFPWYMDGEAALRHVQCARPEVLHGVLSGLRMLAIAADARGGLRYRPALAVSKGELLDAKTRLLIERVLNTPLVDYYATEETGIIAWQCPSGRGYHIDEDMVLVETIDADGNVTPSGTIGEIVVTNLYMRSMPIIRYRTGDLGVISPAPCSCGRGLPLLESLHGRQVDCLVSPVGEIHHPFAIMSVMEGVGAVHCYRIVQESLDRLTVFVLWAPAATAATREAAAEHITSRLGALLGRQMGIEIQSVDHFDMSFGAKFHLVRGLPEHTLETLVSSPYRVRFS